ncbi:taste receptor type 2 member 1-like [Fukomys damarensis]|uniref:taste receptor type 2 member 1-like n=1 Tax=Fukomys damarensis TaxID=885580 RepID=UPI00053F5584|nr:taste receptor type 2 member 1-like [Fukomys damarensis]
MLTSHLPIHFLMAVIQFLTVFFINGFIVLVNIMDFIKHRQMAPLDLLISCLATSRICQQVLTFLVHLTHLSIIKNMKFTEYYILFMFVNICGIWLATWLGVFYCVKIATFPHPLFFWLKMRISKLVPWLILGSILYASVCTGIHTIYIWTITQKFFINFFHKNATQTEEIDIIPFSLLFIHFTVPLIVLFIAVLLLIFSLGRHTQNMRIIATGTRDHSRTSLFRAMLSILSFLILYFSHYTIIILFFFHILQFGSFSFVFCTVVAGIYPSIHSVILILGNPKLKQKAKMSLLCGQCGQ